MIYGFLSFLIGCIIYLIHQPFIDRMILIYLSKTDIFLSCVYIDTRCFFMGKARMQVPALEQK